MNLFFIKYDLSQNIKGYIFFIKYDSSQNIKGYSKVSESNLKGCAI